MHRRPFLTGAAALTGAALTGCAPQSLPATRRSAVFIPGYTVDGVTLKNEPADSRRRRAKGQALTLITRIDTRGRVIQAGFPLIGHDIAISPDRRIGFFAAMGAQKTPDQVHHVAFDPATLELIGVAQATGPHWRGGGHGLFLADGSVIATERAPLAHFTGKPADHFGRLVRRDPETLRVLDTLPCHGIDPHELRLSEDGASVIVANYGSVPQNGGTALGQPRRAVAPAITEIDLATGGLRRRFTAPTGADELRHVALGKRVFFAIRARLADPVPGDETDITAAPGEAYQPSAPVFVDRTTGALQVLAQTIAPEDLRHGLSVEYDPVTGAFLASFPTSHRLIVFDGQTGAVRRTIDTRQFGLSFPCGIALLPGGEHYAVAGYWRDLHVFERRSHRHLRKLSHRPLLYGHSHMTAA